MSLTRLLDKSLSFKEVRFNSLSSQSLFNGQFFACNSTFKRILVQCRRELLDCSQFITCFMKQPFRSFKTKHMRYFEDNHSLYLPSTLISPPPPTFPQHPPNPWTWPLPQYLLKPPTRTPNPHLTPAGTSQSGMLHKYLNPDSSGASEGSSNRAETRAAQMETRPDQDQAQAACR